MRVGVEWASALVEVRDDLADHEPQPSGRQARQASDLPSVPRPGPVEQPKREGCGREQRDREGADEVADLVCDKRVPVQRSVQEVEDRPVDRESVSQSWRAPDSGGSKEGSRGVLSTGDGREIPAPTTQNPGRVCILRTASGVYLHKRHAASTSSLRGTLARTSPPRRSQARLRSPSGVAARRAVR